MTWITATKIYVMSILSTWCSLCPSTIWHTQHGTRKAYLQLEVHEFDHDKKPNTLQTLNLYTYLEIGGLRISISSISYQFTSPYVVNQISNNIIVVYI